MLPCNADQIAAIDLQLSVIEDEIARAHVRARELRMR
jgi:ribosomal protein S2